jgi:hypothetical protein
MRSRLPITLLCLAALLATGCRSTRQSAVTPPPPPETPTAEYSIITFDGILDGIGVSGQIRMAKDSVIWCSVSKFIELGRAMASPDSVWISVPLMNRYEVGDYRSVKQLTKIDITFAELQDILESEDAEQRIAMLARQAGHDMTLRIKRRQRTDSLTFPFKRK